MKFTQKAGVIVVGLTLVLLWHSGRNARHLEALADQYALQTPDFHVGQLAEVPGRVRVFLQPSESAVLCDVGSIRFAILDRTQAGSLCASFSISPNVPDSQTDIDGSNILFGSRYTGEGTTCQTHDMLFTYRNGQIHIGGQSFPLRTPSLVLVEKANEVVLWRNGDHAGV